MAAIASTGAGARCPVVEASAVLGERAVWVERAAQEVSEALAVSAVSAALAEREATDGNTIRHIGEELLTVIAQQQTVLAARLVAIRWLTARPARGIKLDAKAATCPAIEGEQEPETGRRIPGLAATGAAPA